MSERAWKKNDTKNAQRVMIDAAHQTDRKPQPNLLQRGRNVTYSIGTSLRRGLQKISSEKHRVQFSKANSVTSFGSADNAAMITYDSGADGHYISEEDRKRARLPILRKSQKNVGVANGGISSGKYVTQLPFEQLSNEAAQADTFQDFPTSLMSVGKTNDDGNISIFTSDGVTVHKEKDVLITCKGEPIFEGIRDE